jgi:hypothetical protein
VYVSILEVLVFYLVNTVLSVIYVTVYIRHPYIDMQELLGQTCNFRHPSPNSTIPKRGVIFVPKGYHILDLEPVYQDQHLGDSQEIISHQTDLELPTPILPGILLRYLQGYDQNKLCCKWIYTRVFCFVFRF